MKTERKKNWRQVEKKMGKEDGSENQKRDEGGVEEKADLRKRMVEEKSGNRNWGGGNCQCWQRFGGWGFEDQTQLLKDIIELLGNWWVLDLEPTMIATKLMVQTSLVRVQKKE